MPKVNPRRRFLAALASAVALPAPFLVGCGATAETGTNATVGFNPEKAKSQEDGMRRAAEDAAKSRKK